MKKLLIIGVTLICFNAFGQTEGISYQALILSPEEQELPGFNQKTVPFVNEDICMMFNFLTENGAVEYQETILTTSDDYGIVNLVIGTGEPTNGGLVSNFTEILWYGNPKRLEVFVSFDGCNTFTQISDQLLTYIPFANYRDVFVSGVLTADGVVTFYNDLIVDGITNLNNTLNVNNGSPTYLTGILNVDEEVNFGDDLIVEGTTNLNGSLDVNNASPTNLTGTLNVDESVRFGNDLVVAGATSFTGELNVDNTVHFGDELIVDGTTNLNSSLDVNNGSPTNLTGVLNVDREVTFGDNLVVDGPANLNSSLDVNNGNPTNLTGTLNVDEAVILNNTLDVTGITTLTDLYVETFNIKSDHPEFIATFENENGGNGDGLLIKLGRTHGAWNNGSFLNVNNPLTTALGPSVTTVRGWLNGGSFSPADIVTMIPASFIGGAMAQITNSIINSINTELNLPIRIGPYGTDEIDLGLVTIPSLDVIPEITVFPEIPLIPTGGLPQLEIPNFAFSVVANSLTSENEYVVFQDKDGRTTGAIRAQSTQDFRDNTILNDIYIVNLVSDFAGIDLLDGMVSGIVEITNLIDEFNSLGVEYSSGNGDYAEWLERVNPDEYITAGDIVSVKGGKITKNLENVEQIMVVSHKPIILGNTPIENKEHLGNNIAFMGQVPVKVIGPVKSGDYIVANTTVKGYGVAIHPEKMTSDDYKLAVGRSWENINREGPKVVNTVIGVHNGDWVNVVKKIKEKQDVFDDKMKEVEQKLNQLNEKLDLLEKEKNYATN